jgi:hypothetical protein
MRPRALIHVALSPLTFLCSFPSLSCCCLTCAGKSYLMNRLNRQQDGFKLGSTFTPETQGVWAWLQCDSPRYHAEHGPVWTILLDFEGLYVSASSRAQGESNLRVFACAGETQLIS